MIPSSSLAILVILKKLLSPVSSTLRLSRVSQATVKRFLSNKRVPNSDEELIRVNITVETDEDDLIGGFRLVGGETVWHNGPVIEDLQRGAVLLLDEIDLASNKILCLHLFSKEKEFSSRRLANGLPRRGFQYSNRQHKGKGSDDGRFIGTNVLNEAFLERFPVTFEQEYPSTATEQKILGKLCKDEDFCKRLADWVRHHPQDLL